MILSVFSFRLMNAALEAKTADIVKQADQLMVRFIILTRVKQFGNLKDINASSA